MHVLVATDGNLDPGAVASFAAPLAGSDGEVTVLTVIAIPRRLITDLRSVFGERAAAAVDGDAEYVGMSSDSGSPPPGWPGDAEMIERYLSTKEEERCQPLADALSQVGVSAKTRVVESEKISKAIIAEADRVEADVIVIGSHGEGRFEGMLGSTGAKVVRRASKPILLLRS